MYIRMLRAILNKFWKQHPLQQQHYGHLSPISKNIQVRGANHMGHSRRNKDELSSNVPLWTLAYPRGSIGRLVITFTFTMCWHRMLFERPAWKERWVIWMVREREREREREKERERERERKSQGNPYCRHDLKMIMIKWLRSLAMRTGIIYF